MTARRMPAFFILVILSCLACLIIYPRYIEPINIQRDLLGEWVTPTLQIPGRDKQGGARMWETAWSYDLDQQSEAFLSSRYSCRRDHANILVCTRCTFARDGICFLEYKALDSGYYRTVAIEQGHLVVGEGLAPSQAQ